ncbi:hypothetical protein [Halomonas dongshanensis]|uniref:Uncharacterized protein n=1 Tax=Halomonas dongshanensis TaxID=2890835 RepID=A0ABT2EEQ3_9GAMM|nr:hypothetical protein [Halomonas dongshanensis]MCS2610045.1 hypothetical protein [Halomonas dongshanensis]
MSSADLILPRCERRARRHGRARWWFAGLLVGCLLPAGLSGIDTLRGSERVASVYLWMPALLRVQQWVAKRQRILARRPRRRHPVRRVKAHLPALRPLLKVADLDVLTLRGPPCAPTSTS